MKFRRTVRAAIAIFAFLAVFSITSSLADDSSAREKLAEAQRAFEGREDSAQLDTALALLEQVTAQTQDAELSYTARILEARCWHRKGHLTENADTRKELHQKGMLAAEAAKSLNDTYADSYFLFSINLASWAQANGVIASLARKAELIAQVNGALGRNTQSGQKGEALDGWGPNRILGRLYFKLPGFAGGSHSKAVELLTQAVEQAPDHSGNFVYLAEALLDGSEAEKALARDLVTNALARAPETWDPKRVPETREELVRLKKLVSLGDSF